MNIWRGGLGMRPENVIVQSLWVGASLTPMERASIQSFLAHGHEFHLYLYGPCAGLPEGVTVKDAEPIMARAEAARYRSLANFSDVFRYRLIQKTRVPWWVDLDVFCLRSFDFEAPYVFASEQTYASVPFLVNGCVMKADPEGELFKVALSRCAAQDTLRPRGKLLNGDLALGPELLTNLCTELNLFAYVQPSAVFHPIPVAGTPAKFLDGQGFDLGEAHAVHMFHSIWAKRGYQPGPPGCLYNRLLGMHAGKRVLIAIFTCAKNRARIEAVERGWLGEARRAGYDVEIFDGPRLGVPDGYAFLPFKDRGIFRYAVDHDYHGLLKCDDDALVRVDEFKRAPLWAYDYAGAFCQANQLGLPGVGREGFPYQHFPANYPPGTFPYPYAQGGAVWFSRRAFSIMAHADVNSDWACDRWVGHTLTGAGVKFTALPEFIWWGQPNVRWAPSYVAVVQCPNPETVDKLYANPMAFAGGTGLAGIRAHGVAARVP